MDKGRVEVPWFLERGVSLIRLYNLISIQDKLSITCFVFFSIVDWCHECPRILDYVCRVRFPFIVSMWESEAGTTLLQIWLPHLQ